MQLILLQPTLRAFDTSFNQESIHSLLLKIKNRISNEDIVLLPEHFTFDDSVENYNKFLSVLTQEFRCSIIGGSHHRKVVEKRINTGSALDYEGNIITSYSKLRPYFNEQKHISPGDRYGEFQIGGRNILVLICADFWFADLILSASQQPDLILVPALSVSRKPDPYYAQSLWRHLAISRAYEFGVYVGISDWSADSALPQYRTCGVGGFADPTQIEDSMLFESIGDQEFLIKKIDFERLELFRQDRRTRGFYWK